MAVSARQRCLAAVWNALTIALIVTEADAQPTVTITIVEDLEYGNPHTSAASSTLLLWEPRPCRYKSTTIPHMVRD